jgi:RNA polymerase sigma factor (sigma-70 family)
MVDSVSMGSVVQLAARGDEFAWNDIVREYTPLLASVCRRYGLSKVDSEDVRGRVWMHLLTNIRCLREPAALPGWLRTTTRRECHHMLLGRPRQGTFYEEQEVAGTDSPSDARLLAEEQRILLQQAVDGLAETDRRLLAMLFSDPPKSYAEISLTLDMPVGAIGPTRQRILKRLRRAEVWRDYRPTV